MGSLGLGVLMALSTASCSTIQNMSRTITPNAYSESVGPEQVKADEGECFQFGMAERRRLLDELLAGDPAVAANEARETAAEEFGREYVTSDGGSTMAGDVGAAVGGFLFSSWDADTYDENMLAEYLGIEGGLGAGFSAAKRLQYTCLRARGYQVDDHEEDGSGNAHLVWAGPEGITRAILREDDGTERVFFEHIPQSKK